MPKDNLKHGQYASPYYDPEYQHEYYEKHKKLVGRKSTSGLNAEGRAIAGSIKEEINKDKQTALSSAKTNYTNNLNSLQNAYSSNVAAKKTAHDLNVEAAKVKLSKNIEAHTARMNTKISKLQAELEEISDSDPDKSANVLRVKREIAKLREENAGKKAELTEGYQRSKASMDESYSKDKSVLDSNLREEKTKLSGKYSEETAKIGEEYTERYLRELDELKTHQEYLAGSKSGSSKSSKSGKNNGSGDSGGSRKSYSWDELKRIGKRSSTKLGK